MSPSTTATTAATVCQAPRNPHPAQRPQPPRAAFLAAAPPYRSADLPSHLPAAHGFRWRSVPQPGRRRRGKCLLPTANPYQSRNNDGLESSAYKQNWGGVWTWRACPVKKSRLVKAICKVTWKLGNCFLCLVGFNLGVKNTGEFELRHVMKEVFWFPTSKRHRDQS